MYHHFELLSDDLRFNRTRSPWAQEQGLEGWMEAVENEVTEVREDLCPETGEPRLQHAGEELGDVLSNFISLALALEAAGGPSLPEIVKAARDKLRARKPWIFDGSPVFKTGAEEHAAYLVRKAELNDVRVN